MLPYIYCQSTCFEQWNAVNYLNLHRNAVDSLYLLHHQIFFVQPSKDYGSFSCANGRTFVRVCALETTGPTGKSPDFFLNKVNKWASKQVHPKDMAIWRSCSHACLWWAVRFFLWTVIIGMLCLQTLHCETILQTLHCETTLQTLHFETTLLKLQVIKHLLTHIAIY